MPYPRPRRAAALVAAVSIPALALALLAAAARPAASQTFARVTDLANPIFADTGPPGPFAGASWIDHDGDGLPDLYEGRVGLYHNLGGGHFEKVPAVQAPALLPQVGDTWADYDNDGDLDLFLSGSGGPVAVMAGSQLYRNDGAPGSAAGPFTRVLGGDLADSLRDGGWACAWGDYDGDGLVDVAVALQCPASGALLRCVRLCRLHRAVPARSAPTHAAGRGAFVRSAAAIRRFPPRSRRASRSRRTSVAHAATRRDPPLSGESNGMRGRLFQRTGPRTRMR